MLIYFPCVMYDGLYSYLEDDAMEFVLCDGDRPVGFLFSTAC